MPGWRRPRFIALLMAFSTAWIVMGACSADDPEASNKTEPTRSTLGSGTTAPALPEGIPGGRIAFRRFIDPGQTTAALFTMSTDGSAEEQVTDPPDGVRDALPEWSPDGSRLAFQREFADKPYEVHVIDADGHDERRVDPACPAHVGDNDVCEELQPAWSPDGSSLAFSWAHGSVRPVNGVDTIEVRGIAVMSPDGSSARLLTQTRRPTNAEDEAPVWSPDGSRIAFTRLNITAAPAGTSAVFVMNADGTGARRITPWRLSAGDIDWAPDGSRISFSSQESGENFVGDLYTVRPDGSDLTQVTHNNGDTQVFASSFSPDSQWLVFAMTGIDGQPDLHLIRTGGTELGQLTATPEYESAPTWSPR